MRDRQLAFALHGFGAERHTPHPLIARHRVVLLEPAQGCSHVQRAVCDVGRLWRGEHAELAVDAHVPVAPLRIRVSADLARGFEITPGMGGHMQQPADLQQFCIGVSGAGAQVELGQDVGVAQPVVDLPRETLRKRPEVTKANRGDLGLGFAAIVIAVHDRLV